MITGLPWFVSDKTNRNTTGFPTIRETITKDATKTSERINISGFKHIAVIAERKHVKSTQLKSYNKTKTTQHDEDHSNLFVRGAMARNNVSNRVKQESKDSVAVKHRTRTHRFRNIRVCSHGKQTFL